MADGSHASGRGRAPVTWLWVALGLLALLVLAYWQLIIAEGTYLGPRVVSLLYDWVARRYDAIKQFSPRNESWFIAGPILVGLAGTRNPLILDVATGTGRVPWTLLDTGFGDQSSTGQQSTRQRFGGKIVGLDLSLGMLRQARAKLRPFRDQVSLVWQDAGHLPFDDGVFDAVTCLESLEFLPQPMDALDEMVRVLASGGVLFLTNRVGREARLLPRRAISRTRLQQVLVAHGLLDVQARAWQVNYDLLLARKPGLPNRAGRDGQGMEPASLLRCPRCGGRMSGSPVALACLECQLAYPIYDGIVRLVRPRSR